MKATGLKVVIFDTNCDYMRLLDYLQYSTVGIGLSIAGAFSHPTIEDDISTVQYLLKLSSGPLGICPYLYCSISAPPLYHLHTSNTKVSQSHTLQITTHRDQP